MADPTAMVDADLPPMGIVEIAPVIGMVLALIVVLMYGLGCLGSQPAGDPKKARKLGSGSTGRIHQPEGFDDEDSESDEDDKDR
eukprot:CAMPEP_0206244442 /NCGR_PEP_ID=MMETSP0047_2-20121206/18161_1 /ASSEMBLY_ACC=CAM_ASM_000192 /TAXON_ID=195065 /ORGANISM="Chroomonas mesostigmatica_cf, Strain CCMP1168" /LENGTH=83 /DNA_ID=CAMNT_0053669665 /DNA_START=28 /DNA_END=279 /DNA_ORIENTATION=-